MWRISILLFFPAVAKRLIAFGGFSRARELYGLKHVQQLRSFGQIWNKVLEIIYNANMRRISLGENSDSGQVVPQEPVGVFLPLPPPPP